MTAEIFIFIVVGCLVATSAGQLRIICLLIFLIDYQWGPAGANHGPFRVVGRGEQRGSCSLAPVTCWCANSCRGEGGENYLLNLGVCEDPETSGLPNGAVHVFVIWPEALGPLGGSGIHFSDLWERRIHWQYEDCRESCANQEELSAVRNVAHLLQ